MLENLSLLLLLSYVMTGVFTGIISGLLGLGGGIIIVPVLYYLFLQQGFSTTILMHLAITTSLATIIFTSTAAAWAQHQRQAVIWPIVFRLIPGIVIGSIIGAGIAHQLSTEWLRIGFALFELFVALQIGLGLQLTAYRTLPGTTGMLIAGIIIGSLSTLFGIGGGTLTAPFLLWCNINIKNAVAISAACGVPVALAGTIAMLYTGSQTPLLPAQTWGYLYWPAALPIMFAAIIAAPIGVHLAHILSTRTLKRVFAIVLAAAGIKMLTF